MESRVQIPALLNLQYSFLILGSLYVVFGVDFVDLDNDGYLNYEEFSRMINNH